MAFSDVFLQELSDRNEISDVVGGYVNFTKRSGSNLFGLCPFHSEKTPSFSVSPDKQIFYCFGCGKGGGVIQFIMAIENLTFPDAVAFLAKRAGIALPDDGNDRERQKRERLLNLNREAAKYFFRQLISPAGRPAQEYLQKRGISPEYVKKFGLGFAADRWHDLIPAMKNLGYTEQELLTVGLARSGKGNTHTYDFFRNRLIFPVIDIHGNVVAFSGRILGQGEPKYLNTNDTPLYSKSKNLFALNLAKKSKKDYVLLVEGNVDVVSLHQAGFDSAVASLGTSLTPDQARLLTRYTKEIVIAYDGDGAGQKATDRAIGILQKLDLNVRVLKITGAKDPDEFIHAKGPEAFQNLIEASASHIDFRLRSASGKYDLKSDEQKVLYLREAASIISQLPNALEREVYAARVADSVNFPLQVFKEEIRRSYEATKKKRRRQEEHQAVLSAGINRSDPIRKSYTNERSALAEEGVIRLLCFEPDLFSVPPIEASAFSSDLLGRLYDEILKRKGLTPAAIISSLSEQFNGEEINLLTSVLQEPELLRNSAQALHDYVEVIKSEKKSGDTQTDLRAYADNLRNRKGYGTGYGK